MIVLFGAGLGVRQISSSSPLIGRYYSSSKSSTKEVAVYQEQCMEIGSISGSAGTSAAANVSLQKKAAKQEEAVVGKLLESVASTPTPGKGQLINAVA